MTTWTTRAAQALLVLGALGCLAVQVVIVINTVVATGRDAVSWILAAAGFAFVVCVEIAVVCLWRLLTFARSETIFSPRAFRFVDTIAVCALIGGALIILVSVSILAPAPDLDGPPPGMVLLFLLFGGGCWGIALLVVVMRGLLRRAIDWREELEVVI